MTATCDVATAGQDSVRPAPPTQMHRLPLPGFGDVIFIAIVGAFVFTNRRIDLLNDAGTGLHIRNGSSMLASHLITRSDSFSYTHFGEKWFAWEWLSDVAMGIVYSAGGLLAVVSLSAIILAATFAVLYHLLQKRSGDSLVAVVLTSIAVAASGMHMLARPHLFSWLFLTLLLYLLHDWDQGGNKVLIGFPLLILIWVNVHGGFLDGLIVGLIYILGSIVQRKEHRSIRLLVIAVGLGVIATVFNPYGFQLHAHVFEFLRSTQIIDHNLEFASPNFHNWHDRAFLLLTIVVLTGATLGKLRLAVTEWLVVVYALATALMYVRHVPLSSILIAYVGAPLLTSSLNELNTRSGFLGAAASWLIRRGRVYSRIESRTIPWLYPAAMALLVAWVVFGPAKKPVCDFPASFPSGAAAYLRQNGIHDRLFTPDQWGSYLVYELYPGFRAYMDDRSDFYGVDAVRDFQKVKNLSPQWEEVLKKGNVEWTLLPADSVHAIVFSQSADWTTIYRDSVAVLFERRRPSRALSLPVRTEDSISR